ncbi:response regulator [Telluribacter sp. SYSU D00476]|uniref:response regulator n=1 Tax=Telluribacter sp. SYSU D00476 TaxID=2811430 RepID=UPI001FF587CF|nr:response regulator [Telluribacter sp. SYSU D00476]
MKSFCYLIDDDTDDHYLFAAVLKEVCPALEFSGEANSQYAVEKLQSDSEFTPSYIFLDLNMPNMNGLECLAEIKKIERLKEVPVIIFSTSSFKKDINEAAELGSTQYITKPGSYKELTSVLQQLIPGVADSSIEYPACDTDRMRNYQ